MTCSLSVRALLVPYLCPFSRLNWVSISCELIWVGLSVFFVLVTPARTHNTQMPTVNFLSQRTILFSSRPILSFSPILCRNFIFQNRISLLIKRMEILAQSFHVELPQPDCVKLFPLCFLKNRSTFWRRVHILVELTIWTLWAREASPFVRGLLLQFYFYKGMWNVHISYVTMS